MKMQRKEKEGNELTKPKPKSGSFFASWLFFIPKDYPPLFEMDPISKTSKQAEKI